jgi:hypothetical protein
MVRKVLCINDGNGNVEIVRARRNNIKDSTEGSFVKVNSRSRQLKMLISRREVIRSIKSDIEVPDNK